MSDGRRRKVVKPFRQATNEVFSRDRRERRLFEGTGIQDGTVCHCANTAVGTTLPAGTTLSLWAEGETDVAVCWGNQAITSLLAQDAALVRRAMSQEERCHGVMTAVALESQSGGGTLTLELVLGPGK